MARKLPIVEVEWRDSVSRGRWSTREDYSKETPANCTSVGYLLKSDREKVIIVQSTEEKSYVLDSITIPRSCVQAIRKLK